MSLASSAKSAVLWNAGFNILSMGLQFVTTTVLARLLPQAAYGHFGFVTDLISFVSIFAMTNFIVHTVQVKEEDAVHWQDHFTAAGILNVAMAVVMNLVGAVLWFLPKYQEAAPFVHVMSVSFLLNWPKEFRLKMLERGFAWKRLRTLHAIGIVLSLFLAIFMAWVGCGTYSLLIPGLSTALPFIYDLFIREGWRPNWQWSWERFKPAYLFGVGRMGSGLAYYGRQMLVSSVFTSALSFTALGLLNRSLGLAQMFCIQIAGQIVSSIYPILTRVDETAGQSARVGNLVVQTVAWMAIPTAGAFIISAAPLVMLVYGANWLEIIPLLPWAMAWGVAFSLFWAAYNLLVARNRQRQCFYADIANLAGTALALVYALPHGIICYLQAIAAMQSAVFIIVTYWLTVAEGITFVGWFKPIATALAAASIAAAATFGLFDLLGQTKTTSLIPCLSASLLFCFLYLSVLRIGFTRQLHDWLNYVPLQRFARKLLFLPQPA